jgi:hypothetical protein
VQFCFSGKPLNIKPLYQSMALGIEIAVQEKK